MMDPIITKEEAQGFILGILGTAAAAAFSALSEGDQQAALNGAQLKLNGLPYLGLKEDQDQPNEWPRIIRGKNVGTPEAVKVALAIQAYARFSVSDSGALSELEKAGITDYRLDDFSVSFDREGKTKGPGQRLGLEDDAYNLLKPYLRAGGPVNVRG